MIWSSILKIITIPIKGVAKHISKKQELKNAIIDNKIRLAQSQMDYNADWEMASLINAGWKDDILFYGVIALFVWTGADPEAAAAYFDNLSVLPEWFITIFTWLVASVIGVKKLGDYAPSIIRSIRGKIKQPTITNVATDNIKQIGKAINKEIGRKF